FCAAADERRRAGRVRDARQVAAIGARRASFAGVGRRIRAVELGGEAARDAEIVLLARVLLQHISGAAIGVGIALHGLQAANPAGRRARGAVIAAAEVRTRRFAAVDVRRVAVREALRAATVGVFGADLSGRMTAARRLTDEDAGGRVREARAAAALAA